MQHEFRLSQSPPNLLTHSEDDFEIVTMFPGQLPQNTSSNVQSSRMLPYSIIPNASYPPKNETVYPSMNGVATSTPSAAPESCHPLQGIPFKLAPALEVFDKVQRDPVLEDVKQTLERVKHLLTSKDFDYDSTLERNFLRDISNK